MSSAPQSTMSSTPQSANDNWIKVSFKRGLSSPDATEMESKHTTNTQHWLHPPSTETSNRFSALMEADSADRQHNADPENPPKPPPIYIQDITTIPPLLQLLEQVAPRKYETKALANKVKVQPITSNSYRAIIKALAVKCTEFHTYKPKEDRSYKVMLKNMHYSINPADIKTEIEKLGHTVTNIWNIKQNRNKLPLSMFLVEFKPAPNNKDIFLVEYLQQCKIKFQPS
jgi:hypothetical protein